MITRNPMAQHAKPKRKPLPIGDGRYVVRRILLAVGILAVLLLAVGAIGRLATHHGMPQRSGSISGPRVAWAHSLERAIVTGQMFTIDGVTYEARPAHAR